MHAPPARSSRPPWLVALAGLALPLGPTLAVVLAPSCDPGEAREESPAARRGDAESTPRPSGRRAGRAADPEAAHDAARRPSAPSDPADDPAEDPLAFADGVLPDADEPPAEPARPPPIGVRGAARTIIAYAAPRYGSDMRGRIDLGSTFEIFEMVEGTDCAGEGWARVDHASYVCLKHALADARPPAPLPVVPEGLVVPFIYAKPKADRRGNLLAEVPRYKSRSLYVKGGEPLDFLVANHQYAFVEELQIPGHGKVMRDAEDQLVPLVDGLKFEKPSEFFGRDLAERPVPEGLAAAWAISHEAVLRRHPSLKAKIDGQVAYHQALDVKPEPLRGGGARWIEVPDAYGAGVPGYVEADKLRVWSAGLALDDVADDETWIDIDLGQQMLALMRGQEPQFVTLVSSGTGHKPNTATPKGVYTIRNKLAYGPMRNRPEDAEDSPYHVEAVPWVQYFYKRFALHAAYWHNGFGHRKSHGCVNLAPRDARHVFERTGPALPPGWMSAYAHAERPGTVVRVRKGLEPVPDRRTEPEGDDEPLLARAGDGMP